MTNKNGTSGGQGWTYVADSVAQYDHSYEDAHLHALTDVRDKARAEMDEVAMAVLAVGWRPEQCCVRHHTTDDGDEVETMMVGVDRSSGFVTGQVVYVLTTRMAWEGERLMFSCTGRFVGLPHPT